MLNLKKMHCATIRTGICIPLLANATGLGYLQQTTILLDFFLPPIIFMYVHITGFRKCPHTSLLW